MQSGFSEKNSFLPLRTAGGKGGSTVVPENLGDALDGFMTLPMKLGDSDYLGKLLRPLPHTSASHNQPVSGFAAWAVPPAIYQFETFLFGAGGLWLFCLLLTSTIPAGAVYTSILLMLASVVLAAMYSKMGLFWRRTDTGKDTTVYDWSHTLYTDLLRICGYFLSGMLVVFALKSICTQNGFLGDRVFVFLVAFLGLVFHVPFKLVFNDGEVFTVAGNKVPLPWYLMELIAGTCFLLVISDLLVAADGSPLSGVVYWCCSVFLGYMLFNIVFKLTGLFSTSTDSIPYGRYTPAFKAAIFLLHDLLLFAFLIFATAFAATGAPWSGLVPYLPPGTNSTAT